MTGWYVVIVANFQNIYFGISKSRERQTIFRVFEIAYAKCKSLVRVEKWKSEIHSYNKAKSCLFEMNPAGIFFNFLHMSKIFFL